MPEASPGLMDSAKRLLSTLSATVSTRIELLANELQEERLRLMQMLLFALCALFCFGLAVLLLTIFIVVLFWDEHRLVALGVMCGIFFAMGGLMAILLRNAMQAQPKLFSATLAELAKDREHLDE